MGLAQIGPSLMDREAVLVNDRWSPAESQLVIINQVHGFEGRCTNWTMLKIIHYFLL